MHAGNRIINVGPAHGMPFSSAVHTGNLIYISGIMATGVDGSLPTGDIRTQTRQVLESLKKVADAAGSSLAEVASVSVYLKSPADFQAMNEVYRTYWPKDPPVRTTIAADLVLPGGLVEMSAVAVPKGGERRAIQPSGWVPSPNPYSYGILTGDTLFLSGLLARNGKDNTFVAGDMAAQTRTAMDNAGEILKAAGMSHADVVSARIFIPDTALFQDMNAAYRQYFPKDPPARATVKAALMGSQYSVEITLLAVKAPSREAFTTPNADGSAGRANPNLSSAIRVGNRLYVSGMLGNTADNKGNAQAQTRETLARIGRTLRSAGFDWKDVADGLVYLPEVGMFKDMNEAYREIFSKDFPTRATVGTGLVAADGLVEIMFTASKE